MNYPVFSDEYFMNEALKEAKKAFEKDEVPVGAVVVSNNQIIARTYNMTEELNDVTAHSEILAITAAENYIGGKYLDDCTLYVSLEPCVMCASAMNWAKLGRLVYGATDPRAGFTLYNRGILHPKTKVSTGILADQCGMILTEFFRRKRNR